MNITVSLDYNNDVNNLQILLNTIPPKFFDTLRIVEDMFEKIKNFQNNEFPNDEKNFDELLPYLKDDKINEFFDKFHFGRKQKEIIHKFEDLYIKSFKEFDNLKADENKKELKKNYF